MQWREVLTPKHVLQVLGLLAALVFLFVFSRQIIATLLPFIIGLTIATLLDPIIEFLVQRARFPRPLSVLLSLSLAVLLFGYALSVIITNVVAELNELARFLPEHIVTAERIINDLLVQFESLNETLPQVVRTNIQPTIDEFFETVENTTKSMISMVLSTFAGLPIFLLVSVLAIASSYFMAKDKDLLSDTFIRLMPEKWRQRISDTKNRVSLDIVGFIKGRMLLLLIATAIAAGGLLWINTRYWMMIAIFVGVLDNVPVIGPGIVFGPWVLATALLGDIDRAIFLTILYFVIFLVRNAIEPKIMGDSIGIHPLVMLLAIYGGVMFFGVLGLFIGPLISIVIRAALLTGLFKSPPTE